MSSGVGNTHGLPFGGIATLPLVVVGVAVGGFRLMVRKLRRPDLDA